MLTDEVNNETAIGESPSRKVVEEGFSIWPIICSIRNVDIDIVIVSWIKDWISKYEHGNMSFWLSRVITQGDFWDEKAGKETEQKKIEG